MKNIIFLYLIIIVLSIRISYSQNIQGVILSDTGNITIVKVWGTHQERGFACGYLLADKIKSIYDGYIVPAFGALLPDAKAIIQDGIHIAIDSIYHNEAEAMIAGMDSAGISLNGINYLDLLVANSFLDIQGLGGKFKNINISNGCSSMMSWGDATIGTGLDGKSVISRHLDWTPDPAITENQAIIVHIPSEPDEQPWLLVGFAGQMSVLSGVNNSGVSAFQHVLSDNTHGAANYNMAYEPIWFAIRKGLEKSDFNSDGIDNVNDMREALSSNNNGYADGFIVTMLAASTAGYDSLIALVAELTPESPLHTYRSNNYPDEINGDNLYAANCEIKRNDHQNYCTRYNAVKTAIGAGTNISSDENWNIMKVYSNSAGANIQFMQVIPENRILKLSVYKNNYPAYQNDSVIYSLDDFFSPLSIINKHPSMNDISLQIYPNPFNAVINICFTNPQEQKITLSIYNINGELVKTIVNKHLSAGKYSYEFDTKNCNDGIYFCKIETPEEAMVKKMIVY